MIHAVYGWFISYYVRFHIRQAGMQAGMTFNGKILIYSLHFSSWCADWGPKIDVVGFCFLDLASNYEPPESLLKWLEAGQKPIYIGFGSLVSSFPSSFFDFVI